MIEASASPYEIPNESEALEHFRKIFNGAPIGLMRLNAEGRVVEANLTMEELLGYTAEELGSLGVEDITDPQDLGRCVSLYEELVMGVRDSYDIEKRYLSKDKKLVWARARATVVDRDENGLPVFTIMMVEDIADRKRGELAIRRNDELSEMIESLKQFETIFDGVPTGLVRLDRAGRIVEANRAFARMLGLPLASLEGESYAAVVKADQAEGAVDDTVWTGKTFDGERQYARADGEPMWCHVTAQALDRDESGEPQYLIVMVEDITRRRAAEDQLRQSQKIEAIGQLAAGIAHDFNNLLMGVLGYASLARAQADAGTRMSGYLERIEETSRRAATLTAQLLAFGRRQTLQPRRLDLNEFVSETLAMLSRLLGEHIEIVSKLSPELSCIRADPTQIQQVLFNLALNARDAMPAGGILAIETNEIDLDETTELELLPGRYVVLSVADTGVGMAPEVTERIFEPFFTTKEVGEGSGLGLPSVYGIVKQSRGDLEVSSEVGNGTTFRIYLPALANASAAEGDSAAAAAPAAAA